MRQGDTAPNSRLAAALRYAERSWHVLPLHTPLDTNGKCSCAPNAETCPTKQTGKHPRTAHGVKDATTDPDQIRQWWERWPNANIGIAVGKTSLIVSFDVDHGDLGLAEIEDRELPATLMQRTGRGVQYIFRWPGEHCPQRLANSTGWPFKHCDFKGDNNYIVAPNSLHFTGREYVWLNDSEIADLPEWLRKLVVKAERTLQLVKNTDTDTTDESKAETATYYVQKFIQQAKDGTPRNDTGKDLALQLRDNKLSIDEAMPHMYRYQRAVENDKDPPYTQQEAEKTLRSIYTAPPREPSPVIGKDKITVTATSERFLKEYSTVLRYVKRFNRWYYWNGSIWVEDHGQIQLRFARDLIKKLHLEAANSNDLNEQAYLGKMAAYLSSDLGHIKQMIQLASALPPIEAFIEQFNRHQWLLSCNNKLTYDLRDGSLHESRKENMLTYCLPVAAAKIRVPHPRWDAMLNLVMNNDIDLVRYLRQMIALMLTGDVSEQCFWFWFGKGKNGKSTLALFLHHFLGPFATKLALRAILDRATPLTIRHDLAELNGRRLAYTEEFKPGDSLNVGIIKDITGGGMITADRKGEPNMTFASTAKLVIATNDLPNIKDVDEAIRTRVRAIPFTVHIPTAMGTQLQDVDSVIAGLMSESTGILQDLVDALMEWHAQGRKLIMPNAVKQATQTYLDEQDPLVAWVHACCTQDGRMEERPFSQWYWSFRAQSGRTARAAARNWFGMQLKRHGFIERKTERGPRYTGPALTTEAEDAMAEAQSFAQDEASREIFQRWSDS